MSLFFRIYQTQYTSSGDLKQIIVICRLIPSIEQEGRQRNTTTIYSVHIRIYFN